MSTVVCRHYPQLKATVVADTPEMKRYDQMTKQQSQVCSFACLFRSKSHLPCISLSVQSQAA